MTAGAVLVAGVGLQRAVRPQQGEGRLLAVERRPEGAPRRRVLHRGTATRKLAMLRTSRIKAGKGRRMRSSRIAMPSN